MTDAKQLIGLALLIGGIMFGLLLFALIPEADTFNANLFKIAGGGSAVMIIVGIVILKKYS